MIGSVHLLRLCGGAVAAVALMLAVVSSPASAQDRVDIRFEPGASSTTINGTVVGDEFIDYVVNARGGQTMVVSLAVTGTNGNGSAFFNILPAGQNFGGPYTGSTDEDRRAEVTVPYDGDWAIRVYLMGNDRDTDRTVGFSIDVYIGPGGAPSDQPGVPAGIVEVQGVPTNDVLNVRAGPGTQNRIVGALGNGSRVQVLRCEMQGAARWCEIEMQTDMRERGWVNARYLPATASQLPGDALVSGTNFNATGSIRCADRSGETMVDCQFGVIRRGNGNATVVVTTTTGETRSIEFRDGTPVSSNSPGRLTHSRNGDVTVIYIGERERYDVFDAVIYGG